MDNLQVLEEQTGDAVTALNGCRFCGAPLRQPFLDLGVSPLANSYLRAEELNGMEPF